MKDKFYITTPIYYVNDPSTGRCASVTGRDESERKAV